MESIDALNERQKNILNLWRELIQHKSSGKLYDTVNKKNRQEKVKKGVENFLEEPSEEKFLSFWEKLFAAQRTASGDHVYNNNSEDTLVKVLSEMESNKSYLEEWEDKVKFAKKVLWELFGYLHLDDEVSIPPLNTCTQAGLELFDVNTSDDYEDIFSKFKEFRENIYLKKVGHATKGLDYEIPVVLELDQLFNVINQVKEKDIKETDNSQEEELYKIIMLEKENEATMNLPESDKTNYWKISPGKGAKEWSNFKEGGYIAINWDELDYPEKNIHEQTEEEDLGLSPGYVEEQFSYFTEEMKEKSQIVFEYSGSFTIITTL